MATYYESAEIMNMFTKQKIQQNFPMLKEIINDNDKSTSYFWVNSITGKLFKDRLLMPLVRTDNPDIEQYGICVEDVNQLIHMLLRLYKNRKINKERYQQKLLQICKLNDFNAKILEDTELLPLYIPPIDIDKMMDVIEWNELSLKDTGKEHEDYIKMSQAYYKYTKVEGKKLENADTFKQAMDEWKSKDFKKKKKRRGETVKITDTYEPGLSLFTRNEKGIERIHKSCITAERQLEVLVKNFNEGLNELYFHKTPSAGLVTIHCFVPLKFERDENYKPSNNTRNLLKDEDLQKIREQSLSTNKFYIFNKNSKGVVHKRKLEETEFSDDEPEESTPVITN